MARAEGRFSATQPTGINNHGQVSGLSDPVGFSRQGFICSDGVMTALPGLPGSDSTGAQAINDRGEIVGDSSVAGVGRAVIWIPECNRQ
jgi:uncharacterized membrane protein